MKNVYVKALNPCRLRNVQVAQYIDYFRANNLNIVQNPEACDLAIVWTCGVRRDKCDFSISFCNDLKKMIPSHAKVVMAGCLPDIWPERVEGVFGGETLPWKQDYAKLKLLLGLDSEERVGLEDISLDLGEYKVCDDAAEYRKLHPDKDICFLDQSSKLYVSHGCPLDCSFCSEKRMFPEYESYPIVDLLASARKFIERGDFEITLHADCVGVYGSDFGSSLPELMDALIDLDERVTISIEGFNPAHLLSEIEYFKRRIREGKVEQLRLPIQSASDAVLKRMRRTYSKASIERVFSELREAGLPRLTTDIIVGFPGESEEDFQQTTDFLLQYRVNYVMVSKYMDSPTIPSYEFEGKVSPEVIQSRLDRAYHVLTNSGIPVTADGQTDYRNNSLRKTEYRR